MQGTMVGDGGVTDDPPSDSAARTAAEGELRRRRRRVKVRRRQDKLSRPVRIMLWIALPAFLWATMYLLYEALSWMR